MAAKEAPIGLAKPSSDDPVEWADWLEATMLVLGKRHASRSWIRLTLRNEVFPEDGIGIDDLDPGELDASIDGLLAEVSRRRAICPSSYPFECGTGMQLGVTFNPAVVATSYAFLLLISVSLAMRVEARHAEVDRSFDLLVLEALKSYLGRRSIAVRFGAPASGDRPGGFAKAIEWLATALRLPRGTGTTRNHTGDGGVDVVAWLPFLDSREAFLTVLAQCTVRMDWQYKAKDIALAQWTGWIDFGVAPATCLAVPFAVPTGYNRWDEVRRTAVVVLERLRITQLIDTLPHDLNREILRWVRTEIKALGGGHPKHLSGWAT